MSALWHRKLKRVRTRATAWAVHRLFTQVAVLLKLPVLSRCAICCIASLTLCACNGEVELSFLNPQGPVAALQRTHFVEMVALLTLFVALPIFILIPWFAWRYRYGATSSRYTPDWSVSRFFEIVAWSGPMVIVALLAILVWRSAHALDPYKPLVANAATVRVQAIGYDWKWLFIYPDFGIASVGLLPLPAGSPVTIQLTSATVMQSLQIPALGSQIYAMGGMVTQLHLLADKPGRFMGENTMYNGDGFHEQRFIAVSLTPNAFDEWVNRVRAQGVPLDAATAKLIAKRTTRAQLAAALGQSKTSDGALYFNHVDTDMFARVVTATMNGADVGLQTSGQSGKSAVTRGARSAFARKVEQIP